jgi:hypothetical protein
MKKILNRWDKYRLGHKLHQLQKRWNRAMDNGYSAKAESYRIRINEIMEKLKHIK